MKHGSCTEMVLIVIKIELETLRTNSTQNLALNKDVKFQICPFQIPFTFLIPYSPNLSRNSKVEPNHHEPEGY